MERNKRVTERKETVTVVDHYEDEDGITQTRPLEIQLDDDPGYVPCRCEDYPCCGH